MSNYSNNTDNNNNYNSNSSFVSGSFQSSPSLANRLPTASRSIASSAQDPIRIMQGGEEFRSTANSQNRPKRKFGVVFQGNAKNEQGRYKRYYRSKQQLHSTSGKNPITREYQATKLSRYTGAFRRYAAAVDAKDVDAIARLRREGWDISDTDMKGTTVFQYALGKACKDKTALPIVKLLVDMNKMPLDPKEQTMFDDAYAFLATIGDTCRTPRYRTHVITTLLNGKIPFNAAKDRRDSGRPQGSKDQVAFFLKCIDWKMSPTLLRKIDDDPLRKTGDWVKMFVYALLKGGNSKAMSLYLGNFPRRFYWRIESVMDGAKRGDGVANFKDEVVRHVLLSVPRPGQVIKRLMEKLGFVTINDHRTIGIALHAMQYTVAIYLLERYIRFHRKFVDTHKETILRDILGASAPIPDHILRIMRGKEMLDLSPLEKKPPPRNLINKPKLNQLPEETILRFGRMNAKPYDEATLYYRSYKTSNGNKVTGYHRMLMDPKKHHLPIPVASQNEFDKYLAKRGILREVFTKSKRLYTNPSIPPKSGNDRNNHAFARANNAARKIQAAWKQQRL